MPHDVIDIRGARGEGVAASAVGALVPAVTAAPGSTSRHDGVTPVGWDAAVLSLRGHFLQSTAWAGVQRRLGRRVVVGADREWCWLGVVHRVGPFRYLYLPFGPSLRTAADLQAAAVSACRAADRLGCAFVRVEPSGDVAADLRTLGARRVRSRQHQHTLRLRIDVDDEALRRGLNSGHRSRVSGAGRRGLSIIRADAPADIADFITLLRQTEARARFYSHDDGYYRAIADELLTSGVASLYYAVVDGQRVAGALLFDFGDTRYYAFAGSDTERRSVMPAPPLVWRAILDAREKGLRWFDFWGIAPPEEPDHPWAGITAFKRGFGGEVESRAGTWELDVRPLQARLFSAAQSLRR